MNKLSILGTLIPILLLAAPQALADPQHCNSYSECYSVGYGHGYADGQSGYDNVGACHNHSQAYCGGYYQGYRDEVSNNPNIGSQQGESNQVNIHGNNDHVNINQAQNAQSGTSSAAGYSYHDANPRCLLICATVK